MKSEEWDIAHLHHLVQRAVEYMSLDLNGHIVLTEAASGNYRLTSLIAACAGAEKVYAIAKDSRFGSAGDVSESINNIAQKWNLDNQIEFLFTRDDARIAQADIVTNLGFVRPIEGDFLNQLNPKCAIPLMWETWEYRRQDVDLDYCRKKDIPVLGTNESHPLLRTFDYFGYCALKLLQQYNITLLGAKLVVVADSRTAQSINSVLGQLDDLQCICHVIDKLGNFDAEQLRHDLTGADALVVADLLYRKEIIGPDSSLKWKQIQSINEHLLIAQICGGINPCGCAPSIRIVPEPVAEIGYMNVTADYVGPKPLIDLHAAGLKVGALLASERENGHHGWDAECRVLKTEALAQGFKDYHPGTSV